MEKIIRVCLVPIVALVFSGCGSGTTNDNSSVLPDDLSGMSIAFDPNLSVPPGEDKGSRASVCPSPRKDCAWQMITPGTYTITEYCAYHPVLPNDVPPNGYTKSGSFSGTFTFTADGHWSVDASLETVYEIIYPGREVDGRVYSSCSGGSVVDASSVENNIAPVAGPWSCSGSSDCTCTATTFYMDGWMTGISDFTSGTYGFDGNVGLDSPLWNLPSTPGGFLLFNATTLDNGECDYCITNTRIALSCGLGDKYLELALQ
jgi:hypothetical protein